MKLAVWRMFASSFFRSGISVSLQNGVGKESQEAMFLGGKFNVALSGTEESKIHEGPVKTHSSGHMTNNASSSDNGLTKYQEKVTVSDSGTVDADSKQPCPNQVTISLENGTMEGSLKSIPSGGNVIVGFSSSEEYMIHEDPINADSSDHGTGTTLSSDSGLTNLQGKITVSNIVTMDDIGKQPCLDGITLSLENGSIEGSPKAMVSLGGNINVGSVKECTPKKKRKVPTPQLSSLNSSITDIKVGPVNVVSSENGVDTTLSCSVKDFSPADKEVTVSGVGNLDVVSQLCTDGVSILQGNTSLEGFSEDKGSLRDGANVSPNGTSHMYKKRRKFIAARPGLSSPTGV
ncbi:hypothetical protein L1049_025558 [Liquidambar formosana]|uniref:Uncharacterized protein n=1 Tax=Liquidambar formosana TaxID=63359 RepID=A0AAP0R5Q3_LIQFO